MEKQTGPSKVNIHEGSNRTAEQWDKGPGRMEKIPGRKSAKWCDQDRAAANRSACESTAHVHIYVYMLIFLLAYVCQNGAE